MDTTVIRAVAPHSNPRGLALRGDGSESNGKTLYGHFAVFNRWAEIRSYIEGAFLERVAPGAFLRTMHEDRDRMRVLFQHGLDPTIGNKVLGPIETLREDPLGAYYASPLFDTSYNADLSPGLEAGVYGASFRFQVTGEDFVKSPAASAYNPNALPERTIREVKLMEFGPVTFGAYPDATSGVRSLTDWYRTESRNRKVAAA
jgi:HK97 family phage prohead protease